MMHILLYCSMSVKLINDVRISLLGSRDSAQTLGLNAERGEATPLTISNFSLAE